MEGLPEHASFLNLHVMWFALKRVLLGTVMGLRLGLPYLFHLLRDYNPVSQGEMPEIWRDQMGQPSRGSFASSLRTERATV